MTTKEFETELVKEIDAIVNTIIEKNINLSISAKSRAGAEISDFLEEQFVLEVNHSKTIDDAESSPKGKTKNPWDARCNFEINGLKEDIWIDFKALKISSADSNPDIGTPNKVVNFIKNGSFYLIFVLVYYVEAATGITFKKYENVFTKTYLLKDVSHTFRRNPKNQLQVNMNAKPEYRSREEFIKLLMKKLRESHARQIEISHKALAENFDIEQDLINKNMKSESKFS